MNLPQPSHFFLPFETAYGWRVMCSCGWADNGHRSQESAMEEARVHAWRSREIAPAPSARREGE